MIAIVRQNLACLISKHNSFVCKSPVSSAHFFSTLGERQNVISSRFNDLLLHKHQFSPEVASLVASVLVRPKSPENADSILSFLKETGCSTTQLEKIVKYQPRILLHSVDDVKFKIKIFQDLGLSSADIAKMISSNQVILQLSAKSNIIPSLSLLKGLLGSDNDVARLLRKSAWPLCNNMDNALVPNIGFLKTCGISMERLFFLLYSYPRCFLVKPDTMRKSVEKAKEMGFSQNSKIFIYVIRIFVFMKKGMWEAKLQSFQDIGFSHNDVLTMFKKFPNIFYLSMKKVENVKQLLLDTGKCNMTSIVNNPAVFGCSIEKRLEPRLQILEILKSKNLIIKWPSLGTMYTPSDNKFQERFVRPYPDEVDKAFVIKSTKEKKLVNQESGDQQLDE